jgi:hypothetical protein
MLTNDGGSSSTGTGINEADGKFEVHGLVPGAYILTAQSTVGERKFSARLPIQVGSNDIEGIELNLLPPMELTGRVQIEGKTDIKPHQVPLTLEPKSHGSFNSGSVKEDGTFRFKDLEPDLYYISAFATPDFYLKSVRWGDEDVTESGIDLTAGASQGELVVVLSANRGAVVGMVENDNSEPVAGAFVVLMPVNLSRTGYVVGSVTSDPKGHFSFQTVAPGRYKLIAWDDVNPNGAINDAEQLQLIESKGDSVDISEHRTENVRLKVVHNPALD